MNRLAVLVIAAAALLSPVAGCDKKKDASPAVASAGSGVTPGSAAPAASGDEVPADEAVRRIRDTADKICTCPDRACAMRVRDELTAANQQLAGRPRAKPTEQQAEEMQAQAARIQDCMSKLQ